MLLLNVVEPVFVITYGPPVCGKSTIARSISYIIELHSDYIIIDVDTISSTMANFVNQSQIISDMVTLGVDRNIIFIKDLEMKQIGIRKYYYMIL